jgi:hypothetical protein
MQPIMLAIKLLITPAIDLLIVEHMILGRIILNMLHMIVVNMVDIIQAVACSMEHIMGRIILHTKAHIIVVKNK